MIEVPTRIEPCFFEESTPEVLKDLVTEIQSEAEALGQGLPVSVVQEISAFVRIMNSYYSNAIEGHVTKPDEVETALRENSTNEEKRPLVQEAKAHVIVQREIDEMFLEGTLPVPTSVEFISWVHKRLYEGMPDQLKVIGRPIESPIPIVPGKMRFEAAQDVSVGRHQPPSSNRVFAFMDHFSKRYQQARVGATSRIMALAAAHHRLNYIHPFPDGNGRVSRLMSHAMALDVDIGGQGLWSISRALALGLRDQSEYMRMMDYADHPRMGDRDGRGNLSSKALAEYSEWFLSSILEHIKHSSEAITPRELESRYRNLVSSVIDNRKAPDVISIVLKQGSVERDWNNTNIGDLIAAGFLKPASMTMPIRIGFPATYRDRLFPGLFPDMGTALITDLTI